jgi:hypothetical protein
MKRVVRGLQILLNRFGLATSTPGEHHAYPGDRQQQQQRAQKRM